MSACNAMLCNTCYTVMRETTWLDHSCRIAGGTFAPVYLPEPTPIPMIHFCPNPMCARQHIDIAEWATKPHRTHRCGHCGHEWRPANVPTVGVAALPVEP